MEKAPENVLRCRLGFGVLSSRGKRWLKALGQRYPVPGSDVRFIDGDAGFCHQQLASFDVSAHGSFFRAARLHREGDDAGAGTP